MVIRTLLTGRCVFNGGPLGWMALAWVDDGRLHSLSFARSTPLEAIEAIENGDARGADAPDIVDVRRAPAVMRRLAERLQRYAEGRERGEFRDVPLFVDDRTDFQRRVIEACRAIEPGETLSYGEVAERSGAPRGGRAVGNVMRTNRAPLVVPCHRVVGSGGALHGFSAPQGLTMKQRLLDLERSV